VRVEKVLLPIRDGLYLIRKKWNENCASLPMVRLPYTFLN
jgi:hypothetical protein